MGTKSKKPLRFFILLGGLGLGNSTRQFAILEKISELRPDSEIHIATWGVGFDFFRSSP